jgi:capsular polysaccharide biosynthesis protein
MPERSKAVERSCRLFRRLLVAYPKAHRDEYGAAILQLFHDQCRDAWVANRTRGLIGFWLRALTDLLKTSVWEHLSNAYRRKFMFNLFRSRPKLLLVFVSVFAAVFLLTVAGSILITLLYPKTYGSETKLLVRYAPVQTPSALSSGPWSLAAELQVIQSDAVLGKASEMLGLRESWGKKYNNGQPLAEADVESLLKRRLELIAVRNSDIMEIRAFSDNPDEAATLANGVARAYLSLQAAELAQNAPAPAQRRVDIIQRASSELKYMDVRPHTSLNIVLGTMIGTLMGGLSGTVAVVAVWLLGRWRGNTSSPRRPASANLPG